MSQQTPKLSVPAASAGRPWLHFALAAGLLLVVGAGWNSIMSLLRWTMAKFPVPHPPGVELSEHRLISFPEKLGPYVLMPEGVTEYRKDDLATLGTLSHELNWYYAARYRDSRVRGAGGPDGGHCVLLFLTYYTGLLDAVPHIPLNCLGAAGFTIIYNESGPVPMVVPTAPAPWDRIKVYRTTFAKRNLKTCQYHFFSINGRPSEDWKAVRARLSLPWVRYCFFAKVQLGAFRISPGRLDPETDPEISGQVCQEFLGYALPTILRFLPTAEDVERLEHPGKSG